MKLSVIIPVYNAVRFLENTVQSVLNQNCRDMEIILVDDGSNDGSAELCYELSARSPIIKVINKENGGVSSARNAGIEVAQGKYITFIDADDSIGRYMFSDFFKTLESTRADFAFCGFEEVSERCNAGIIHIVPLTPRQVMGVDEIVNTLIYTGCTSDSYMNSVCGRFYRADIIRSNKLRFKDRPMGEDWLFNMHYCDLITSAVYIDRPYYKYMRNSSSAVSRYQPRQFELWRENRAYRRKLMDKYHFSVDQCSIDSYWVVKVLYYALDVAKHDAYPFRKMLDMFRDSEFTMAVKNAGVDTPKYFKPVIVLLQYGCIRTAALILLLYSKSKSRI